MSPVSSRGGKRGQNEMSLDSRGRQTNELGHGCRIRVQVVGQSPASGFEQGHSCTARQVDEGGGASIGRNSPTRKATARRSFSDGSA